MRKLIAGLAVITFIACNKGDNVPKGVLEREQMQAVMWDILQADEFLKDYMLNKDTTLNDTLESIKIYERVFRFHKTTRDVFDSSFSYYRTHPKLMKEVLDSLQVRSQRQAPTQIFEVDQVPTKPIIDTSNRFPRVRKVLDAQ